MAPDRLFSTTMPGRFENLNQEARDLLKLHDSNLRLLIDRAIPLSSTYAEYSRDNLCFYNIGRLTGLYRIDILATDPSDDLSTFRVASAPLSLDLFPDGDIAIQLFRFRVPQHDYTVRSTQWLEQLCTSVRSFSRLFAEDENYDEALKATILEHLQLPEDVVLFAHRMRLYIGYVSPNMEDCLSVLNTTIENVYFGCKYEITPVVKQELLYRSWQRLAEKEILQPISSNHR